MGLAEELAKKHGIALPSVEDEAEAAVAPEAAQPATYAQRLAQKHGIELEAPVRAPAAGGFTARSLAAKHGVHAFDERKGTEELLGLGDYVADKASERWEAVKENPIREFPVVDVLVEAGKDVVKLVADITDNPKLYEELTGEKLLTDSELASLPPEERRRAQRRQQTMIENLVDEITELGKAIPTMVIGGAGGLANVYHRGKRAADKGEDALGVLDAATAGVRDTAAGVVAGLGKSFADLGLDPVQAIHDGPLEQLANVSGAGGAALKAVKGAGAATAFRTALQPTHQVKKLATNIVNKTGSRRGAQFLIDKRAGVDQDVLGALESYQTTVSSKVARRLDELEEAQFHKLKAKEADTVYRALSSETAQRWAGNLAEKQYTLLHDLNAMANKGVFKTEPKLLEAALDDPVVLDGLRSKHLGTVEPLATEVTEASKYNDVRFTVDGEAMDSVRFLFGGKVADPSKIKVEVLTENPVVHAHADNILRARQMLTELGEEARQVGLIGDQTFRVHGSRYVRDIYKKSDEPVEVSSFLESRSGQPPKLDSGMYEQATLKHFAAIEDRVAAGAMSPEQLHANIAQTIVDGTQNVEWRKLTDIVAHPEKHGLPSSSASAFSLDDFAGKPPKKFKRDGKAYRVVPDDEAWGSLRGMALEQNTYNLLASVQGAQHWAARAVRKAINSWKFGRVVANLPSHANQAFGNFAHQILDEGITGSAKVPQQLAASARSLHTKDNWYAAARDAGLLTDNLRLAEAGDMLQRMSKSKNPLAGVVNEVRFIGDSFKRMKGLGHLEKVLKAHEYVNVSNPVSRALGNLWKASDDVSKVAFFRRSVERESKARGLKLAQALEDKDVLDAARRHVDQFHPKYDDVPYLLEGLDKYGIFPFVRYGWKTTGLYANMHAMRPGTMNTLRNIRRDYYENADEETQRRLEQGMTWADGKNMPVDPIAKLLGYEKPVDINARFASPLPTVMETLQLKKGGSFGADLYDTRLTALPKGPSIAIPYEVLSGHHLEFDREMSDEERIKNFLYSITPGFAGYNFFEKVVASAQGKRDMRGRQLSKTKAFLHYIGVKTEDANPAKIQKSIVSGARMARAAAAQDLRKSIAQATDEDERREVREDHQKRLAEINDMQAMLLKGAR